jgi:hypothetical protein
MVSECLRRVEHFSEPERWAGARPGGPFRFWILFEVQQRREKSRLLGVLNREVTGSALSLSKVFLAV